MWPLVPGRCCILAFTIESGLNPAASLWAKNAQTSTNYIRYLSRAVGMYARILCLVGASEDWLKEHFKPIPAVNLTVDSSTLIVKVSTSQ